jgi:hypothetical protein
LSSARADCVASPIAAAASISGNESLVLTCRALLRLR